MSLSVASPLPPVFTGAPGAAAASQVAELQARIRGMQRTRIDSHGLPTAPGIAQLLPGGVLRAGAAYSVHESTSLALALLAGPSAAGAWCGVVGLPALGVEAAAAAGIDLDRLVLVPEPGQQWLQVTAALADVVTVVLARPPASLSAAEVARLGSRLRQRGSTLIALGEWPQSEATLRVSDDRWMGLGDGHGYLAARRVTVSVTGRTLTGKPRRKQLWLPDTEQVIRSAGLAGVPVPVNPERYDKAAVS
ncbi:hypothetical protein [Mycetocola sp.]|uniref:hypothetical protein n=1 Tax=Mycetocola sp. TaxID=1871042 RepID=UPI003989F582